MVGEVIGSYRVLQAIGEGGMGRVYLAEHSLIGKKVAIKVLLPEFCNNPGIVSRFFNEARATAQIKHPSLIEIYDFGHHPGGSAFIVMEFLDGESLAKRLQTRGPIQQSLALELARQVANALQATHAKGIIHRDLKPDNVFLVPEPDLVCGLRAKVLDFGIAKLADEGTSSVKTRTGALMGTPAYMSPEQCRGAGAVDHRTDIYSLGCMMVEMLSGRPPFIGEGPGDVIAMHLYEPAPSLARFAPMLDPLIQRMLVKKPQDRFPSMNEVLAELDVLARKQLRGTPAPIEAEDTRPGARVQSTTLGAAASEVERVEPRTRSRRAVVAAVASISVLALAAGVWGLRAQSTAPAAAAVEKAAAGVAPARPTVAPKPPVNPAPTAPPPAPEPPRKITLNVESRPEGASVYRQGQLLGVTPFSELQSPSADDARYLLKLSGYHDAEVSLSGERDGSKKVALTRAAGRSPEPRKTTTVSKPEPAAPQPSKDKNVSKPAKNDVLDPFSK
jgi:eukaryotic-like serine/threonine-protein kinase